MHWLLPTFVLLAVLLPVIAVLHRPRALRPAVVRVERRPGSAPGHK